MLAHATIRLLPRFAGRRPLDRRHGGVEGLPPVDDSLLALPANRANTMAHSLSLAAAASGERILGLSQRRPLTRDARIIPTSEMFVATKPMPAVMAKQSHGKDGPCDQCRCLLAGLPSIVAQVGSASAAASRGEPKGKKELPRDIGRAERLA